jgi:ketosteroid isomerase-like protein
MNANKLAAIFLAGLLGLAPCMQLAAATKAGPSPGGDQAAIRAAGESWNTAYNALNTDALVALYAADALLMPDTAPTAKGPVAIRKFLLAYAGVLAGLGYTPLVTNVIEVEVSGPIGFRSGSYAVKDKTGAVVDTGKWLEIWRKSDGKWLISRDIWNSDTLPIVMPSANAAGSEPST